MKLPRDARALGISPFVFRQMQRLRALGPLTILDVPCGYGRHALWSAINGHHVTAVDIDPDRIEEAKRQHRRWSGGGSIEWLITDASQPLPIDQRVDLMIVVDFISEALLHQAWNYLRAGGTLIYETFGARGGNWRELLPVGRTEAILGEKFRIDVKQQRRAGLPSSQVEAIKFVATAT